MFRSIRELMNTPFARPPGRRSVWFRAAPELCALLVYLVLYVTSRRNYQPAADEPWAVMWWPGMAYAYLCAGVLLLIVPVLIMAGAFAGERERFRADAMLLTTVDRSALAWGRFLHLALPWLRFIAWLLPLYVLHAVFVGYAWGGVSGSLFYGLGPKVGAIWDLLAVNDELYKWTIAVGWDWRGLLGLVPRSLNDAIQLFACLGVAYYISARLKRTRTALITAGIVVPVAAATMLAPADWTIYTFVWLVDSLGIGDWLGIRGLGGLFGVLLALLLVLAGFVFKIWLVWKLVGRVARNFDAWALGEKTEP